MQKSKCTVQWVMCKPRNQPTDAGKANFISRTVFECPISIWCTAEGTTLLLWCKLVLTVLDRLVNGLRQYLLLPVWFLSLNIMFEKYIHVVVLEIYSFVFLLVGRTISACQDLFTLSFVEVDLMASKFFDTLATGSKPCV